MKEFRKLAILAALAFTAFASVSAQNAASKGTATIQIMAVVPAVLRLSLDFSQDATTQVTGYIPGAETLRSNASYTRNEGSRFEIKSGATVDLGNAKLFSNMTSSYSVEVYSANGGNLRDPTSATKASIPYQLYLGDAAATARDGTFSFTATGKSTKDGSSLKVALTINNVPQTASSGFYSDQLMFSVSAN